ncbi:uncharacterized protein LOC143714842 [Siphateles boraxobius]|uniref:uncharacterized protein LOC143714842 n=1 Tax=Siphateles boraxobius TaxID=180520 RepID=UPI00406497BB
MKMASQTLRLLLLYFILKATVAAIKLWSPLGLMIKMPCQYEYETRGSIQQLSLQWRSPRNQLLCHLIKHKKYSNCTAGYSVHYKPGNITLIIAEVRQVDFGRHVCSVSKLHEFSDFSIELSQKEDLSGELPKGKVDQSGSAKDHFFLLGCSLFVSIFV